MFKVLVICGCLLAVAQAGVIGGGLLAATAPAAFAVHPGLSVPTAAVAVPTLSASTSNIIRGIGNLGAISADAKSVETPFSSVRKADVRVTNPGIVTTTAIQTPVFALNSALAAPLGQAFVAPGLATTLAAGQAYAGLSGPIGINGLALNGLGHLKVI